MGNDCGRILITGGAGFIGSHFVEAALKRDYNVTVLDNLSSGKSCYLPSPPNDRDFRFVKGDIRRMSSIGEALEDVEKIVHLAALVSVPVSIREPRKTALINSLGTLNLLEASVKKHVKRVVFASSSAVYGDSKYLPIDEAHPTAPISPYAASKLAGEGYCNAFNATYGLETVCLRFFNVYGLRQSGGFYAGVILKFLERLGRGEAPIVFGDGSQTRDFVHVSDVVEALLSALNHGGVVGENINVGSGSKVTINELAQVLMRIAGKTITPIHKTKREGEIEHSEADIGKAVKLLGYRPKMSLEKGLTEMFSASISS